jgi:hypothetical protein
MTDHQLKYPIGEFNPPSDYTPSFIRECIAHFEAFPKALTNEVAHLQPDQLNTPYRPGGWTIRQVVHHCADSHMNSLIRFKLALTEENPTIKPYLEDKWAELPDTTTLPVDSSLKILEGVHVRWVCLLKSFTEKELNLTFYHPQLQKSITLAYAIAMYTWHSQHHLAHITSLKKRMGW